MAKVYTCIGDVYDDLIALVTDQLSTPPADRTTHLSQEELQALLVWLTDENKGR